MTLADLTGVTLVSKHAAHNSLQMSSSRDLAEVSVILTLLQVLTSLQVLTTLQLLMTL